MSSKYWSKKVETKTTNESWQEPFSRETTVSPRSIQALDTLLNFSGSWAAAYSNGYSTRTTEGTVQNSNETPNNPRWRVSKLGLDGFPELNFIPYNYRTNALGSKGGSLIGHPISFSIVGPTLKTIYNDWEWTVDATGNSLTLVSPSGATLTDIYGDISNLVNEGKLFLTITETGAIRKPTGVGVTIDGMLSAGFDGLYPKEEYGEAAKFEIFRVVEFGGNKIDLDPNKRLETFFEIPTDARIKSLTFFQPYVTRLAAVPSSGEKGAEKVFMVVSPEHSAFNDLHEPKNIQTEPFNARYASADQVGFKLPIPIPNKTLSGTLESTDNNASKSDGAGVFRIYGLPSGHNIVQNRDIIHITDVVLHELAGTENFDSKELLGWFEVLEAGSDFIQLRKEIEVDPNTGLPSFAENLFLDKTALSGAADVRVTFSVHSPVSDIFEGEFNVDKIEACRLKNLIDPAWVDRTTKQVNDDQAGTLYGGSPARADRAIFTTNSYGSSYADAGSLLDLGFRMVLFPAKEVGGKAVPDFSKPITSLETNIDPSNTTEKQTITVDYSAGTVTLSHAPTRGGTINPNGIAGAAVGGNNTRGEIVLFAACVPFSMEEGQTGVGVSISGGDLSSADHGYEEINFKSTLGEQVYLQVIGGSNTNPTVVSRQPLPPRGRISLVDKLNDYPNDSTHWSARFGNTHREGVDFGYSLAVLMTKQPTNNGYVYLYTLQGLFSVALSVFDITLHDFVLRKENPNFLSLSEDTSYGSAWRSDSIRFAYADLTANPDGSVTVMPTAVAGPAQELRGLFPLGSDLELGRVSFQRNTQRWVVSSKPSVENDSHQVGFEVLRGKAYVSDRDYLEGIETPRPVISLAKDITLSTTGAEALFFFDIATTPFHNFDLQRFSNAFLSGGTSNDIGAKALVVGQSVASQEINWRGFSFDGHRFVVAVKLYDGTDKYNEGPNNPIHWISVEIPTGSSLLDVRNLLSAQFNRLDETGSISFSSYITEDLSDRLVLTERFIEVMPSQPMLKSADILVGSGFNIPEGRMVVTVKSADPRHPERWITVPLEVEALSSSNPIEIAAHLNRPLYDRNHPKYVGHILERAGFISNRFNVSNPYLQGGVSYGATTPVLDPDDQRERQFLFAANDDPRHPAHGNAADPDYNKVILLCGGVGCSDILDTNTSVNGISEADGNALDSFFNVLVEIAEDEMSSGATSNLAQVLGNEFVTTNFSTEVVRCGLFYKDTGDGVSWEVNGGNPPNFAHYNTVPTKIYAKNNELFGSIYGTLSIAAYLGTHDFDNFNVATNNVISFGGTSDRTSEYHNQQRLRINYAFESGVSPNLSKLVFHKKNFERFDFSDPNAAGFWGAWITYTNRTVEEHQFAAPLYADFDKGAYDTGAINPPLIYSLALDWAEYQKDPVSLKGEQVFLKRQGQSSNYNGIILQSGTTDVLALMQDFEADLSRSFFLETTGGSINPISPEFVSGLLYDAEIIPSNSAILERYRSTMMVRNQKGIAFDSENLGGFDNATYMMGGHIDLFSSKGATNPAGLSLGTLTRDSLSYAFLTHIEQGVFRRGGYGAYDSEPFYSNRDKVKGGLDVSASWGADTGTTSTESSVKDGVAGVRFSGDTQIWLKNVHSLTSGGRKTAAVMSDMDESFLSKQLGYPIYPLGLDYGSTNANVPLSDGENLSLGGHTPYYISGAQDSTRGVFQQATILLGLTQKDFSAWKRMSLTYTQDRVFNSFSSPLSQDDRYIGGTDTLGDVFLTKNLVGKWIRLDGTFTDETPIQNVGSWQIIQAPLFGTTLAGVDAGTVRISGFEEEDIYLSQKGSDFVATVMIRVGRYVQPNDGFRPSHVSQNGTTEYGYSWEIHNTPTGTNPIFCAEVCETGGSPTGINNTLNGLTINPIQMGKASLPFQVLEDDDIVSENGDFNEGELFGVFPMVDAKGSPKSFAYFTYPASKVGDFTREQVIRGIVRSWSAETLLEDMAERTSKGAFSVDVEGRIQYQQKQRLGLGVVIDGGLGVIHATGFRANPRPIRRDTIGSFSLYGSALYPNTNYNGKRAPIHLASTFDTTEFIDDVFIVSPKSAIIFEDARGAEGLAARLKENIFAWSNKKRFGQRTDKRNTSVPNDALLPYNSGGVVFKGSGVVSYERPYNYLSKNSIDMLRGFLGKDSSKGLRGMGINNTSAYFLLPKGPINQFGASMGKKTNWNDGTYPIDAALTPDSVPLYEFVETRSNKFGSFGLSGLLDPNLAWKQALSYDAGTTFSEHVATGGNVYQGYRHSYSRSTSGGRGYNQETDIQVRLLEGMIVENTTNGTFYSLGETGRQWIEKSYGSIFANRLGQTGIIGRGDRPAVQGSRFIRTKNSADESDLFYDLNPFVGFKNTDPLADPCWGSGDRTDTYIDADPFGALATIYAPAVGGERTHVRNTHIGHNLRVTANAEFVPILGKYDCDGGLIPAKGYTDLDGNPTTTPQIDGDYIEDADAILYSLNYQFKPAGVTYGAGDIGKFLYLCGTETYSHTGWWLITDVIEDYQVAPQHPERAEITEILRDVAVLRKWHRHPIGEIAGNPQTFEGALPLRNRSPILRATGPIPNNSWLHTDMDDLMFAIHNYLGEGVYGTSVSAATLSGYGPLVKDLPTNLNANTDTNGVAAYNALKVLEPTIFFNPTAPAFIKWSIEGLGNTAGGSDGTLVVHYDLSLLTEKERNYLTGHMATLTCFWQTMGATGGISTDDLSVRDLSSKSEVYGKSGFFSKRGVNSAIDRGAGDRNNSAFMGVEYASGGFTSEFSSYSAARGIRWVFSHPLMEEHMGSYLHLERPVRDFFDGAPAGYLSLTGDGEPPAWTSRFQTYDDVVAGTLQKKVDIFRINRCPNTYHSVIGGDCELYYREPLGANGGVRLQDQLSAMMYSPLSIDFPCLWLDADTRKHEDVVLFNTNDTTGATTYTVAPLRQANRYALQPIARERIISINPTSMESSVILEESHAMIIHAIETIPDPAGTGAAAPNLSRIILRNPSAGIGKYYPPQQSLNVGAAIVFRNITTTNPLYITGIAAYSDQVGYIMEVEPLVIPSATFPNTYEHGATAIKVFTPNLTGFSTITGAAELATGYFAISEGHRPLQVEGTDASTPWKLLSKSELMVNHYEEQGTARMNWTGGSFGQMLWCPASRWWQIMNPMINSGYMYDFSGNQLEVNMFNGANPNVLRIDLTEAFTQAQQSGSGIGSPLWEKKPKGVRLNRIWVNFGLWGNPMTNPQTDAADFESVATPAFIAGKYDKAELKHQAMTFNLVVQIPSVGARSDMVNLKKVAAQTSEQSAVGTTPFNGRAPTSTTMLETSTVTETYGTYNIPLYVNREAGDLSPNVQERFATFGYAYSSSGLFDWGDGHGTFGMGVGNDSNAYSRLDLYDGSTEDWVANSANPVVWGGINNWDFSDRAMSTGSPYNSLVKASLSPRSSIVARERTNRRAESSTFGGDFWGSSTSLPKGLHPQGVSGITIAHAASFASPPQVTMGVKAGYDLSIGWGNDQTHSSPHSFTVALTPVSSKNTDTNAPSSGLINSSSKLGKFGHIIEKEKEDFEVGDWLSDIASRTGFSPSMLPVGSRVYLEVTVPHTRRKYNPANQEHNSNGCWVGQVLCSFEVETADGTAHSINVNTFGDE